MIKLVPDPTFEALVRLTVPGQPDPVEVPMTFRHMSTKQAAAWWEARADKPVSEGIGAIVSGWRGVMGEDGCDVPYSPDALAQLLDNYRPAATEIVRAWQIGLTESRVKN